MLYPGLASKPALVAEDVALSIPFSRSVRTANVTATAGTVLFDEATKVLRWTVGKLTVDKTAQLSGIVYLQPGEKEESPSASFHWKVPSASVSGLSVASLQLTSESYKPYKGVRSMAQAGKYTIRLT